MMSMERSSQLFDPLFDEQLTKLHVRIQSLQTRQDIRIIQVASVRAIETCTTTLWYLARKAARFHQKILVIDLDSGQWESRLHGELWEREIPNNIPEDMDLAQLIQKMEPQIDRLSYLVDRCHPERLFGSTRWRSLLEDVRQQYELVLIDSPPLSDGIVSRHIAHHADATLLVVASNHTRQREIEQVVHALRRQGATLLGAILTQVKLDEMPYYNRYRSVTIEFAD